MGLKEIFEKRVVMAENDAQIVSQEMAHEECEEVSEEVSDEENETSQGR